MEEKLKNTAMMDTIMTNANDNANLRGYKTLARLQSFIVTAKSALAITLLKDEEFEELLAFAQVSDAERLEEELPDETLFKYRTVNDTPLKGLMKFGDDEVVVDFKKLPDDHMIPEVVEAQRCFVIRQMISKFRKKLVMIANRELTSAELEEMRPDTVQRLARLAEVLVDGMSAEELEQNGWGALKKRIDEEMAK